MAGRSASGGAVTTCSWTPSSPPTPPAAPTAPREPTAAMPTAALDLFGGTTSVSGDTFTANMAKGGQGGGGALVTSATYLIGAGGMAQGGGVYIGAGSVSLA